MVCGAKILEPSELQPSVERIYKVEPIYKPPVKSDNPLYGGICLIIGGTTAMFNGMLLYLIGGKSFIEYDIFCCLLLVALFGLIAVLGGIVSIFRKFWEIALVGGICCLLSIGPFFISSILGLIGIILISISKDKFW